MPSFRPSFVRRFAIPSLAVLVIAGAGTARAGEIEIGGTGAALGTMGLLLNAYVESHPKVAGRILPSLGSSGGIRAVLSDAIDLAVTARPPRGGERAAGATALRYATTALVPAVAPNNPATGLTSADLLAIYRGEWRSWPNGDAVRLVLRPRTETDTAILNGHIPGIEKAADQLRTRPAAPIAVTDQENADIIQQIPGGIGLVALSLLRGEDRPLKALALDGVVANEATIASGAYPLRKTFYLITKGAPSPEVGGFIAFVLSAEGRALLSRTGHAPVRDSR